MAPGLTCREAIAILGDYLEQTLDTGSVSRLEGHLGECAECTAYLTTYMRTRDLVAVTGRTEMPRELKVRLRGFLMEQLAAGDGMRGAGGD
jgi:hypothetical protein